MAQPTYQLPPVLMTPADRLADRLLWLADDSRRAGLSEEATILNALARTLVSSSGAGTA